MKYLALLLMGEAVCLAQPAALLYDRNVPQVAFAASEIHQAYAASGRSMAEQSLEALGASAGPLRLVIAADRAQSQKAAGALAVAGLKSEAAQSYSIRRVAKDGRTTVAVLAADPAGAMYGGLDVAEAIRLGTLDDAERIPTTRRTSSAAASSSTSRSTPARPATPTTATPRSTTSPRCGAWISGASSSTRWRAIATTCCRSGTCTRSLRS